MGLFRETFHLLRTVLKIEARQADDPNKVTEFNLLFAVGYKAVVDTLVNAVPFEVPPTMQASETDRMLQRYEARLRQEGVEEGEIPKLLSGARDEASGRVTHELRASFVLDRIATDRKVLVTESEVHQELANMAGRYNRTVAEMEEYMERQGLMGSMRSTLRERKTLRELRDVLTIVDAADAGTGTPQEETTA